VSVQVVEQSRAGLVDELRGRITALQGGPTRVPIPTHPRLGELLQLQAGGSYVVDSAALALLLAAGPSQAGEWVGFAGWRDFGAEAAAQFGVDLRRTVLVPDPGEHWLEVASALIDVLKLVVLRPATPIDDRSASVIGARLRSRSAALVVWGEWPRPDARLGLEQTVWSGLGQGYGVLRERRARVVVRRGGRPVSAELVLP
jgi:hypothetical protein